MKDGRFEVTGSMHEVAQQPGRGAGAGVSGDAKRMVQGQRCRVGMRRGANPADARGDQGRVPGVPAFEQLLEPAKQRADRQGIHDLLNPIDRVDFDFDLEVALDSSNRIYSGGDNSISSN